jgi:patatin-related protein
VTERADAIPGAAAPTISPPPVIGDIREVRFAVVLYGGVSLAIYMNGVAQELLRMVRATAPAGLEGSERTHGLPVPELTGSEKTYRKLGQLTDTDSEPPDDAERPLVRRFVIDIISGSSAGGINGVYLAKALANRQEIKALEAMWVEEGDIAMLLNDRGSLEGLRQRVRSLGPPRSLLNGRRMYRKLLEALDAMDGEVEARRSTPSTVSPYADQIDLYVTATDLQGLLLPLRIANGMVMEKRHRNVFHFRYATEGVRGEQINEFQAGNNPFLAFAARCTSSFPFAFEPMVLSRIDDDLADFTRYPTQRYGADSPEWPRFFRDYLALPQDLPVGAGDATDGDSRDLLTARLPFKDRQFGDGGSLDNKPFTWATSELLRRRANNPVDRKLLFVEPDPSVPSERTTLLDPLENVVAQALLLPRDETVRSDLEAVLARNEVIRRMESVLLSVETRLDPPHTSEPAVFTSFTLNDEAETVSATYAAYHTLRVEAVIDDLANLASAAMEYPGGPGYIRAIRYVFDAWVHDRFPDYAQQGPVPAGDTLTSFLYAFDMQYRFRRLDLVKKKIDHVFPLTDAADVTGPILDAAGIEFWPDPGSEAEKSFQAELLRLKAALNEIEHLVFRRAMSDLRPRPGSDEVREFPELVERLGLDERTLQRILRPLDDLERRRRAWTVLDEHRPEFRAMSEWLERLFRSLREEANRYWGAQIDPPVLPSDEPVEAARRLVQLTWERFEAYDSVAFPMLFGADVGEADEVEIIRISPVDAKGLRNVERPGTPQKVAGSKYGHFGGFLDEQWRKNDILWGRLDAAELLVSVLVPVKQRNRGEVVERLRKEAQAEIIREHFTAEQRAIIARRLMDEIAGLQEPMPTDAAGVGELAERYGADRNLRTMFEVLVTDDDRLLEAFARTYVVDPNLPAGPTVKTLGRSLHVIGNVLRGTADQRGMAALRKPFFWVGKIGQLVSGTAEASIPGSWTHLLTFHWLALFYLFGAALFVIGFVFGHPALQRWALSLLLITLAVNVALWVLRAFLTDRRWWVAVPIVIVGVVLVGMAVLALQELGDLGREHPAIPFFGRDPSETIPTPMPSP